MKQITSDQQARAAVMDRKINSITIGAEARQGWEISKLMNGYINGYKLKPKRVFN